MGSKSKMYEGQKYKFEIGSYIAKGGNGKVYHAINIKPTINQCLVVKFYKKNINNKSNIERFERFKNEVKILASRCRDIEGIIQIFDYDIPEKFTEGSNNSGWYLMPKLDKYEYYNENSIFSILYKMLQLAYTIKILHSKNLAHRDIKPENILIKNNKLVLVDFGLVWQDDIEGFTLDNERIGPIKILPPEMEEGHHSSAKNIDYRKSDIYLFAKVLWMYLKNDRYGFRGIYNRGDESIYIDKNKLNVPTLEPIHLLLEGATKTNYFDRISIDEIISQLQNQLNIIEGNIDSTTMNRFTFIENIKKDIQSITMDECSYTDITKIVSIINSIKDISNVFIKNMENKDYLIPLVINNLKLGKNNKLLFESEINNFNVNIFLKINKLTIKKNTYETIALLDDILGNELDFKNIEEINLNHFFWGVNKENYYIPSTFELHFN